MYETKHLHVNDRTAAAKADTTEKKTINSPIFIKSLYDSYDGLPSADERFYNSNNTENIDGHQALGYITEHPAPLLTKAVPAGRILCREF